VCAKISSRERIKVRVFTQRLYFRKNKRKSPLFKADLYLNTIVLRGYIICHSSAGWNLPVSFFRLFARSKRAVDPSSEAGVIGSACKGKTGKSSLIPFCERGKTSFNTLLLKYEGHY
jgi:hypothetical protein